MHPRTTWASISGGGQTDTHRGLAGTAENRKLNTHVRRTDAQGVRAPASVSEPVSRANKAASRQYQGSKKSDGGVCRLGGNSRKWEKQQNCRFGFLSYKLARLQRKINGMRVCRSEERLCTVVGGRGAGGRSGAHTRASGSWRLTLHRHRGKRTYSLHAMSCVCHIRIMIKTQMKTRMNKTGILNPKRWLLNLRKPQTYLR